MKTILAVICSIVVIVVVGFFSLPILIEKKTSTLRSEVQVLKERQQKIEEFIKSEKNARKNTQLPSDADVHKIIKTVNAVSSKLTFLEDSLKKNISGIDDATKKQKAVTDEAFKRQAEAIDKINKNVETMSRRIMFRTLMASIREHVLKVKIDLLAKNIGTAKSELELLSEAFEKARASTADENKKAIEELQGLLKKVREEVDTDLPSATNRIDLLWYELGKLLRKT